MKEEQSKEAHLKKKNTPCKEVKIFSPDKKTLRSGAKSRGPSDERAKIKPLEFNKQYIQAPKIDLFDTQVLKEYETYRQNHSERDKVYFTNNHRKLKEPTPIPAENKMPSNQPPQVFRS